MALLPRYFTRLRTATKAEREMAKAEEHPDPTPIAPPIGYKRQPSLAEQIRQMVHDANFQRDLADQGVETMEEADDFDVDDDFDPRSPYEHNFDPDPGPPAKVAPVPPSDNEEKPAPKPPKKKPEADQAEDD